MDTSKVTRVEVIDHTKPFEDGGGRCYTFWSQYDTADIKKPKVEVQLQDNDRTLKVFISQAPTVEKKIPCSCPKGGMDSYGRICPKCDGTEWVTPPVEEKCNGAPKATVRCTCGEIHTPPVQNEKI